MQKRRIRYIELVNNRVDLEMQNRTNIAKPWGTNADIPQLWLRSQLRKEFGITLKLEELEDWRRGEK